MSFPAVQSTSSGNSGSLATTHSITLPAGSTGEYILLSLALQGDPAPTLSGFTLLFTQDTATSSQMSLSVYYKLASVNTTETISFTTGSSAASAYTAYRISGWSSITQSHAADGSGTTVPQPPTHAPGSAADYLWVTCAGWNGTGTLSAYPYTDNHVSSQWANVNGVAAASSTKNLNASSDSPGAFTTSTTPEWVACTIAVLGSGGGGGSGSANVTEQRDTCTASGQYASPGSANATEQRDTAGTALVGGNDWAIVTGSYGPYFATVELRDSCVASGGLLPNSNPIEQHDSLAASGFVTTASREGPDTLSASGTVRTQCQMIKVWKAGQWLVGTPKVYAHGTWENVPKIKVFNGTSWVGCN